MSLENLMSNPWAWAILSICTIVSLVFGIYTWFAGKKKKEISCYKDSYNIIFGGKSVIPELQLLYKDREIDSLSITKYTIWNSGNVELNWSDIVEMKPLRVTIDDNNEILDTQIICQSDETNIFTVDKEEKNCSYIKFDYANPKDGIVVQILHTGMASSIDLECKIKGGNELKKLNDINNTIKTNPKKEKRNKICRTIMLGAEIILMSLIYLLILLMLWGVIPKEALIAFPDNVFVNIGLSILCLVLLILVFISYLKFLRKVYRIDIPSKLRNYVSKDKK